MIYRTTTEAWIARWKAYQRNVFPGLLLQRAFFITVTGLILMAYWKHG